MDLVKVQSILASSEPDKVSREINDCIHDDNDSPHSHGIFSYHLIEGLNGKAADPDTGIITIDNLKKYISTEMVEVEKRHNPIYYVANGLKIKNIRFATAPVPKKF